MDNPHGIRGAHTRSNALPAVNKTDRGIRRIVEDLDRHGRRVAGAPARGPDMAMQVHIFCDAKSTAAGLIIRLHKRIGRIGGTGANRLGESDKVFSLTNWWPVMSKHKGLEGMFDGRHF